MKLKLGKVEVDFPVVLALFALLVIDNVYVNHCKTKALSELTKEG